MATAYHGEGPVIIRAAYDGTTAEARYNGSLGVLATGTGGGRQAAIEDCLDKLAANFPGAAGGTTQNLLARVPIIVLPEVQTYQNL